MNLFVFLKPKFEAGKNEERTEYINNPVELFEQGNAHKNEDQAEDKRAKNPPEQNSVLIDGIYAEVGKNQKENENVVDTKGLLNQVSREIVERGLRTHEVVNPDSKNNCLDYPDSCPDETLFDTDFMRLSIEDFQVNNQHCQDVNIKYKPKSKAVFYQVSWMVIF